MRLHEVYFDETALRLSDAQLGALARVKLRERIELSASAAEAKKDAVRAKLGTPIEIDGITYASRALAKRALGISHGAFVKRFGYADETRP